MTDGSSVTGLRCMTCAREYDFAPMLSGCPACQAAGRVAIVDVVYDPRPADADIFRAGAGRSIWRYRRMLPVARPEHMITLGEGGSPLLSLAGDDLPAGETWVKYEAVNPTHSFKDRTNAVALSAGRQFGFEKTLCTSTGNHGVSMAAYAARAGMRSLVLLSPGVPAVGEREIQFAGGETVVVRGNVLELMAELADEHSWYISQRNAAGVGGRRFGNPFGVEGYKTIAYEIFEQLDGRVPGAVLFPVGGGDGAWGVHKGFRELVELGLADRVPRIIACQSDAGAPLVEAVRQDLDGVAPVSTRSTIAYSIVERQSGDHALRAIRESYGTAVAVSDHEIRAAQERYRRAGICVEPSSAASLAGLHKLGDQLQGEVVVVIATGAGLRWPATFEGWHTASPEVCATVEDFAQAVAPD